MSRIKDYLNLQKGTEAEKVLAELLRKYLPQQYSIGSGFVAENENLSSQMDIIIYDNMLNVPIYKGVTNGVFRGGSVYGCIEVTMGRLTRKKLETDIKKLGKLRKIFKEHVRSKEHVGFKKLGVKPHSRFRPCTSASRSPMRSSVWLADNFHPSDSSSIPTFNPASNKARLQKSACPEST